MLFLIGCADVPPEVTAVVEEAEVGTLVVVEWDSAEEVLGTVSAGAANRTPGVVATHHRHTLWGLPPDALVTLTVEEAGVAVADVSVRTNAMPGDIPDVTLELGAWEGFVVIPYVAVDGERTGALVVDGEGRTVAWSAASKPHTTSASWDGTAIWYNVVNVPSELWRVPLDGGAVQVLEVPDAHHEFVLLEESVLPGGGVAYLRTVEQLVEGENVFGDQLVFRGLDGSERVVWDAFETEIVERHEGWDSLPGGADWTHANGIARDDARGTWLISLYWLGTVLEVDEASGQVVRRLEGATAIDPFGPQHAPEATEGGLLLFDNQLLDGHSRVVSLDWEGRVLWEWSPEPAVTTLVLGDIDRLPDGRTLTAWGTDRAVIGLDSAGEEAFRVRMEERFVVGQPESRASLYE